MFINFTNHPSEKWNDEQRRASKRYGDIIDLPFPQIVPNATDEELQRLSQEYVQKIMALADSQTLTVHIMGEMTFTFMVVTKLKELGIKCVASTTERKTTYNSNGVKLSEFSFVKFREY